MELFKGKKLRIALAVKVKEKYIANNDLFILVSLQTINNSYLGLNNGNKNSR